MVSVRLEGKTQEVAAMKKHILDYGYKAVEISRAYPNRDGVNVRQYMRLTPDIIASVPCVPAMGRK